MNHSSAEYKTLLRATRNRRCCGYRPIEDSMELLKLEVQVACDHFWGNPNAPVGLPKIDPGAGGFKAYHMNFGNQSRTPRSLPIGQME